MDSGATASDLTKIKGNAVQLALPIAKSAALKDAADHLGSLFGKDLNRKDAVQFQGFFTGQEQPAPEVNRKPYESHESFEARTNEQTPSTSQSEFDNL